MRQLRWIAFTSVVALGAFASAASADLAPQRPVEVAPSVDGLAMVPSPHKFDDTVKRLEKTLKKEKFTVFAVIDHHKGAAKAQLKLRPITVIVFGNPKVGTQLMAENPTAGIDLPMKLLVWEDDEGKTMVGYNTPDYLVGRHGLKNQAGLVAKMRKRLPALVSAALK